ncbi:hypothetical protein GALMADRAFT_248420 [Galerina marginata CBS 339.88]|uniref:Calcineurin-like phosphoesterase domain-containing protein n=1 Tax=Galerina marginata (strain CBS 339.88) TaxID=685588 RepID=A0A067T9R5_GALM3|nr:hypothetical protein GALMADRAFT_248420 [Galerina marginata CBS 339.88]
MLSEIRPTSLTLPRRSHLYSPTVITNVLKFLWVVLVIWGDLGAFFWSLSGCRWPEVDIGHKTRQKKTTHVLLIADPQVHHPVILAPGSWWANPIRRVMFELNLRKSWHVTSRLRPHTVIFLGDVLANGKAAQNIEEYGPIVACRANDISYQLAAQNFKSIFEVDPRIPVYYIPGNNDVGLGYTSAVAKSLRSFYVDSFGPLNQKLIISNHTFIALDAPALVDEDYQLHAKLKSFEDWKPIEGGPVAFVREMGEYGPTNVVLLSHIPLARPETADCGPLREKGRIRRSAGSGYQSMLGKHTTDFLLKSLEPMVVFSADNRDYCDYTHVLPGSRNERLNQPNMIREVTVKSFSMSVHIKRPGFQLLSLVDPAIVANPNFSSFADTPCLLPDQSQVYTGFYFPCLCITVLILSILNFRKSRTRPLKKPDLFLTPSPRSSGPNTPSLGMHADPPQWSSTWSPYSPAVPVSPRATLPSYLRTPRTQSGSTTHLVASLPGTPMPSSPSSQIVSLPYSDKEEEEEDDTLYPTQYAIRRDLHRPRDDDEWSQVEQSGRDDEGFEMVHNQGGSVQQSVYSPRVQSQFISAPDHSRLSHSVKRRGWSWSYAFVLRGRRRRISVGLPSWASIYNLLDLLGLSTEQSLAVRKRRGVRGVLLDTLSVFWPAAVVWLIINWTIL